MNNRPINSNKKTIENMMTIVVIVAVFVGLILLTFFLVNNVLLKKDVNKLSINASTDLMTIKTDDQPSNPPTVTKTTNESKINSDSLVDTLVIHDQPDSVSTPSLDVRPIADQKSPAINTVEKKKYKVQNLQPKKTTYADAITMMNSGKYREAIDLFSTFRSDSQPDHETLKKITYYLAKCQTSLYLGGSASGSVVINAWYNVQDVYSRGSDQFKEADSILSLFGANR